MRVLRTSPHTVMCSRWSMFVAAAIPAGSSSRSQMNRAMDTTWLNGWGSNHSVVGKHGVEGWPKQPFFDGKVALGGGASGGLDQWAPVKEFPPHLPTIVPVAA